MGLLLPLWLLLAVPLLALAVFSSTICHIRNAKCRNQTRKTRRRRRRGRRKKKGEKERESKSETEQQKKEARMMKDWRVRWRRKRMDQQQWSKQNQAREQRLPCRVDSTQEERKECIAKIDLNVKMERRKKKCGERMDGRTEEQREEDSSLLCSHVSYHDNLCALSLSASFVLSLLFSSLWTFLAVLSLSSSFSSKKQGDIIFLTFSSLCLSFCEACLFLDQPAHEEQSEKEG